MQLTMAGELNIAAINARAVNIDFDVDFHAGNLSGLALIRRLTRRWNSAKYPSRLAEVLRLSVTAVEFRKTKRTAGCW